MTSSAEMLAEAATMVRVSTHMVAFTGAGISTPSGIPDFRSAGSGLWERDDPMRVASATAFKFRPQDFYSWLRPLVSASTMASPNPAHIGLAALEKMGILKAVITQNIDGLHQKASSTNVIELHGSMQTCHCPDCGVITKDSRDLVAEILNGVIPRCERCGAVIKPGITLYEEALPMDAWQKAESEINKCDLLLIAGSSLEVFPAATLPLTALENGSRVLLINYSTTPMDGRADLVLNMDVSEAIPRICEIVLAGSE